MADRLVEADYVVVGAGATAMSFADVVLTESDRDLVIVDQHAQPGGHWNHAYSFVRLHQPSAYYGVSSRQLGRHVRDVEGLNAGLFELATGAEVLAYFDDVLREQFLPTGRVTYLPMSEYFPDGTVVSALTGHTTRVRPRRRLVDAHYLGSDVPSVHTPSFEVGTGVSVVPINDLTHLMRPYGGFVVLGAGKTAIDACLWLLGNGVEPSRIVWVRPRDLWLFNRARLQPDTSQLSMFADLLEASAAASDGDDLVARLERADIFLRVDPDYWPTTFRGATASPAEVETLRRIKNVVRMGHVIRLDRGSAQLEHGTLPVADDWLYVDCTAEGLRRRLPISVFEPGRITLQFTMFFGVPTYSAALIARTEVADCDDATRNAACPALIVPDDVASVAPHLLSRLDAPGHLAEVPGLVAWNDAVRLNPATWALGAVSPQDEVAQQSIVRILEQSGLAQENLRRLCAAAPAGGSASK
jgi:hypothetical protein